MNNKGFTLIELLAVIVIISILGGIAAVGVISTINSSKNAAYNIMVNNIVTASKTLYDEVNNSYISGSTVYQFEVTGTNCSTDFGCKTNEKITISDDNRIDTNLQSLVSNGFLDGINNECIDSCNKMSDVDMDNCMNSCSNFNNKILIEPRDKKDIGACEITITKSGNDIIVTASDEDDGICPTTDDYAKGNK